MEKKLIKVCAWCGRVQVGDRWEKLTLPEFTLVSHGICPDCEKASFVCCRHCENILDAGAQYCRVCGAVVE